MLSLPKITSMPDINITSEEGGGEGRGGEKCVIFTHYCLYVPRVLARVVGEEVAPKRCFTMQYSSGSHQATKETSMHHDLEGQHKLGGT